MKAIVLIFLFFLSTIHGVAPVESVPSPIIFIYDASGSMWESLGKSTKKTIAAEVLSETLSKFPDSQQVGLVAYGHRNKNDCEDVEFLVEVADGTKSKLTSALRSISPLGMTPLARSAALVIEQIKASKTKATVILITDGIESCEGNICEVVKAAKKEGVDFRLHIVGFGLKSEDSGQLICAAKAGNGRYFDASDEDGLATALTEATSTTIDTPKANVSVFAVKNGIAIDAIVTAYDIVSKRAPISVRTYRDTVYFFLPPSKYNFEAILLEGSDTSMVTLSGIQSFEEKLVHQDINFDAGKVTVTTTDFGSNWDCLVKVVDPAGKEKASIRTYRDQKVVKINPVRQTSTIQALAINSVSTFEEIENVSIKPAGITPISYEFKSGVVEISTKIGEKFIDAVVTVDEIESGNQVASGRTYDRVKEFLLNPGSYSIKIVPLGEFKNKQPQVIRLDLRKGEWIAKTLNF